MRSQRGVKEESRGAKRSQEELRGVKRSQATCILVKNVTIVLLEKTI